MSAVTTQNIRVLIADDHVTVREGLSAVIDRQGNMSVIGQVANGEDAVALWLELRPDVGLFDLRMPRLDGIGAISRIRSGDPAARLIVLTTFDTDTDVARAVKAGARGYLLKDASLEEVLGSIRRVHAGETCMSPALVAELAINLSEEALTQRELEVLTFLERGDSNKDIGDAMHIGEATVKSHLRNIFTKLGVLNRTEAVAVAHRRGLTGH